MEELLSKYNQNKRNGNRIISTDCIIRKRESLLHICLNSSGCRYRKSGSCTMCDYGQGVSLTLEKLETVLPRIKEAAVGMQSILIGTLGSVLDVTEVSLECLEKICDALNEIPIHTVIFETHYKMVNVKICRWLKRHLPKKDIVIEVGLESVDMFVQEQCLNKKIDTTELKTKIELLHNHGMSITANAFLGAPFLTVAEQIKDTEKTINWAINNKVDSVVIFPANIRKNTLLNALYRSKKYVPIQHWAIFELLHRIPLHYLNRIYLAWYGDWIDIDESGDKINLPPHFCKKCSKKWMDFYHQFLTESDSLGRKQILQEYCKSLSSDCDCYYVFQKSVEEQSDEKREIRADKIRNWLACQCDCTTNE